MKCAFICWRPYQVINAINIAINNIEGTSGCSDIFLQNIPSLVPLYNSLINHKLFENVFLFDEENRGDGTEINSFKMAKIYAKKTVDFAFPQQAIIHHCETIKCFRNYYDVILSSGWISFNTELINCNPKSSVIMFEDGFANYISNNLDMIPQTQKLYFKLFKLFGKGFYSINVDKLYVYEPELVNVHYDYPVLKLPKINNECHKMLVNIFHANVSPIYLKDSVVYLDQPLNQENEDFDVSSLLDRLSKLNSFIYRRHPLQKNSKIGGKEDITGTIWEIIGNRFSDRNLLISPYSTALVTPYLLYGKYPVLLFLYKLCLLKTSKTIVLMDEFLNRLKTRYNNNIFVPESISQLNVIIKKIEDDSVV